MYGEQYVELSGGIFPVYPGREDVPGCGQSLTTYSEIRGNAFYCFEGDFIAYDDADLLPQLYEQLGPAVIGVVLAHEWGHAIQRRIGYQDATIYMEQQADCFAGAWIAHLARGENPALPFADADLKNAINGMIQVRDQPGTGATGEAAHGTAFDRVGAFQDGFINGASQCATYPENKPTVLSFGYDLDVPIDQQENAPFESTSADPSQPNDILSLVVAELNVFWPPLVDGMPELTLSPYDGDPESECSDLPDGSLAERRLLLPRRRERARRSRRGATAVRRLQRLRGGLRARRRMGRGGAELPRLVALRRGARPRQRLPRRSLRPQHPPGGLQSQPVQDRHQPLSR